MEVVDPVVGCDPAGVELARCRGLAAGDNRRVVEQAHLVQVVRATCTTHESHRVPRDGGMLRGIEAHRAVEGVVVLDVEFQFQAGEICSRQMLHAEMIEIVVSVPEAEYGEIFGGLEDARDGDTCGCGIVNRCCRGAASETLQLEVAAQVEDVETL